VREAQMNEQKALNKQKILYNLKRDYQLYLFLLIPVIYIIIFAYVPMAGISIAFKKFSPAVGFWKSPWVGFAQFEKFFKSYQFVRVVSNTLILSLYSIAATFPIPIIFALMMNSLNSVRFKKITQTIVTMPHFISVVVLVGILMQLFNSRTGLYGAIVMKLTGSYPPDLFSSPTIFRHMYVWSGVWQNFGWNSIIYIAALSAIDPSPHEAAVIDGASRFQRILYIDFPGILPTVITLLILRTGSVMTIGFEKVFLMQNGLNLAASEIISTYVYKVGLASSGVTDFSYSTAIGLFNSVINMILICTVNYIARKVGETSLW